MQISYDTAKFAFCLGFSDDMHNMTLAGLPLGMLCALVVWPCRVNLTSVTLWFSMQFLRTTEQRAAIKSDRGNRFLRVNTFSRRKKCYTNLSPCQRKVSSFVWCCSTFQSDFLLASCFFFCCYSLVWKHQDEEVMKSSCALGAQLIRAIYRGGRRVTSSWRCSFTAFLFTEPMAALKTCCFAQLRRKVGAYLGFLVIIMRFWGGQSANELSEPFAQSVLYRRDMYAFLSVAGKYLWNDLTCFFPHLSFLSGIHSVG